MEIKKLAITGANGYLGKYTIKKAVQRGWNVVGIVRRLDAAKEVESIGAKATIIENFNTKSLKKALIGCRAVIHFRGVVCGSKEEFKKINIEGMRVLIEAAVEENISRIIFISGLGVDRYGKEEWANNEYFHSKKAAENILFQSKLPYIIFRPSYILGPYDELIPEIIDQIYDGVVHIIDTGKIPMQPIYVKDAVNAFLAVAEGIGPNNQIYDLVGPKEVTMLEFIDLIYKNMINQGLIVPYPRINHVRYEDAQKKLDICKEMIDVMKCDIISDGTIVTKALNFKFSDLNEAIKSAIKTKIFPNTKETKERGIILLSGGIDSATALYWAKNKGYEIIALSFNYKYRPEKEKQAVFKLTDNLDVKLIEVPVDYINGSIDLLMEGYPIPSAIHAPEGFIPSRNLIFYSIATYFAEIYGCKFIIGGHIIEDPKIFPDSSPDYFKLLERLINEGKHEKDKTLIKIILPLINMKKTEVLKLAKKLNVPFKWTWSCYFDEEQPCGRCSSCQKRQKAFLKLNFIDQKFFL